MDAEKRAALLRERHKAIAGGFAFKTGPAKAPRYVPRRTEFRFVYPMGFTGGPGYVGKWVVAADEKPEPTVAPCKRRKGKAALTLIAEKWDRRHEGKAQAIGRGFARARRPS